MSTLDERRAYQREERAALLDIDPAAFAKLNTEGQCRGCGCSDSLACESGCAWATEGLCTACDADLPADDPRRLPPPEQIVAVDRSLATILAQYGEGCVLEPSPHAGQFLASWSGATALTTVTITHAVAGEKPITPPANVVYMACPSCGEVHRVVTELLVRDLYCDHQGGRPIAGIGEIQPGWTKTIPAHVTASVGAAEAATATAPAIMIQADALELLDRLRAAGFTGGFDAAAFCLDGMISRGPRTGAPRSECWCVSFTAIAGKHSPSPEDAREAVETGVLTEHHQDGPTVYVTGWTPDRAAVPSAASPSMPS